MNRSARFAAAYALLRAAADLGDHWVQSDGDAQAKAATDDHPVTTTNEATGEATTHRTREGRIACARHVATYTTTQAAALAAGNRLLDLRLDPRAVAAALAVSAVTHYAADRRVPGGLLERLATATGKGRFFKLAGHGMNGSYCLDQAWHHAWETVAALVAAQGGGR